MPVAEATYAARSVLARCREIPNERPFGDGVILDFTVLKSNLIWPFPRAVLNEEDFDMFFPNTISHDVGRLRNDEFTGAFDLTLAANERIR